MQNLNLRPLTLAILGVTASTVALAQTQQDAAAPPHQLSTIVVSAAGFEQDIKNAPASITVVTQEDFKTKRINSVADALSDIEGIDISPTAGKTGGLNVRMRGMDSEYTLVLIDGRRQNSTGDITPNGFGESNNNFIPPISAIERIEIIRGPASTLYGSDAMGGVVNIITKKVADEWSGSITLDATVLPNSSDFGNQRAVDTYVSGPLIQGLLGVQLRGRFTERDQSNLLPLDDQGNAVELSQGNNPTKSDLKTLGARFTLTPNDNHDVSVEVERTEQWYDNSKEQLGTLGANGGYADSQEFERDKFVLSHTWRNDLGTLDSSITNNKTETIGRLIPARAQLLSQTITPRNLSSEDIIFDTKFATSNIDKHKVIIGAQWWDASIQDNLRAKKEVSFEQLGLFAEDTISLTDNLGLTLGLRYDDHSTFGDFWTPRAYLVWNANDNWTFKGGYSEGYKAPRLERLTDGIYNVSGQGRTPTFGNPDLKPETSKNFELGTYFTQGNVDFNITGFYSEIEDKIVNGLPGVQCRTGSTTSNDSSWSQQKCEDFMESIGTPWTMSQYMSRGKLTNDSWRITRPTNADEAVVYGVETGFNWSFANDWKIALNYTWTETELKDAAKGNPSFNDTPKHMANATVKWQADDKIQLWARGEYRSERDRYPGVNEVNFDETQKPVYDALGDFKGYTLFHIGSSFSINNNWDVGVAMYNVFDKNFTDYHVIDTPDATNTTATVNSFSNTQEGRRLQLSTTFKF